MMVAIDGPSGAGKGTVARAVASALGCAYVDTGAMYRAVAWLAEREHIGFEAERAVAGIATRAVFALDATSVAIDGHDVTAAIRTPDMDVAAATVARLPRVRDALVRRQRELAGSGHVVMEGRDIGTVVLPNATVKIYLDASPEERAARRAVDPAHGASKSGIDAVAHALEARDHLDRTRQASPLMKAPDAVLVETTGVSIDDVVSRVLAIVRAKLGAT